LTFTIDNILCHVDDVTPLAEPLHTFFDIKKDGFVRGVDWKHYQTTGQTVLKTKYKPEYINLYNYLAKTFPSGRVGYVLDWCDEHSIPYVIQDVRQKPSKHLEIKYHGPASDGSNGQPPRLYQIEAPKIVEEATRGILWHATASGKTATAARIICHLGVNTLYVVPSLELLNQTHEMLHKMLSVDIGKIGEGVWRPKSITVATTATLWSRFDTPECKQLLNSTELLIVDEVHHVNVKSTTKDKNNRAYNVNSWYIIAINCPAYYRVGLTGTPGKNIEQKRALLECAIGRVIHRVSTKELIDIGVVSDVEVHMHEIPQNTVLDYASARRECVLTNEKFNDYVVRVVIEELKNGKNALLVTNSKAHQGPLLVSLFKKYGYDVPFVTGDEKKNSRKMFREDFRDGKINCLIGTIYKEGVDFPKCDCGVLCDGGYDEKATIQFLGRILRISKGKGIAHLHDFFHKDKKYLQKHSNARLAYYVDEDLDKIKIHKSY